MIIKDGKVFLPFTTKDKLEMVAGALVLDGFTVERAKIRSGKSFKYGIFVSGDGEVKEFEEDDDD